LGLILRATGSGAAGLHRGELVRADGVILRMVSRLGRVVGSFALGSNFLLLWLLNATLFIRAARFRRIATVCVARRSRWSSVSHIIQTSPILLVGLLLGGRLFFPLTHPLWANRWRPIVGSLYGRFRARTGRVRRTILGDVRGRTLGMVGGVA
jgi:hypothetical protein